MPIVKHNVWIIPKYQSCNLQVVLTGRSNKSPLTTSWDSMDHCSESALLPVLFFQYKIKCFTPMKHNNNVTISKRNNGTHHPGLLIFLPSDSGLLTFLKYLGNI